MVKSNYQTHTTWCDGKDSPRKVIQAAVTKGFEAIGFSSHAMLPESETDWVLYGLKGLVGDGFPGADKPLQEGSVSYHMRTGEHNLTPYDWDRYIDFADRHGWRK